MASKIEGNREGRLRILGVFVVRNFNWLARPTRGGTYLPTENAYVPMQ
jgi:hypothetical protein